VIAMLQRKNGATLAEIMKSMGWQKHTVRGFMAGAMKKAGYQVESFKSDKGDRTYRIAHVRREVLKGAKQCN
jgi:predicted transcriptional regulator